MRKWIVAAMVAAVLVLLMPAMIFAINAGHAKIGGEEVGQVVVRTIGHGRACLVQNHGVFSVGPTVAAALKAAVMVEDVARTVWLAMRLGRPIEIPPEEVRRLYERYQTKYGQKQPFSVPRVTENPQL